MLYLRRRNKLIIYMNLLLTHKKHWTLNLYCVIQRLSQSVWSIKLPPKPVVKLQASVKVGPLLLKVEAPFSYYLGNSPRDIGSCRCYSILHSECQILVTILMPPFPFSIPPPLNPKPPVSPLLYLLFSIRLWGRCTFNLRTYYLKLV